MLCIAKATYQENVVGNALSSVYCLFFSFFIWQRPDFFSFRRSANLDSLQWFWNTERTSNYNHALSDRRNSIEKFRMAAFFFIKSSPLQSGSQERPHNCIQRFGDSQCYPSAPLRHPELHLPCANMLFYYTGG